MGGSVAWPGWERSAPEPDAGGGWNQRRGPFARISAGHPDQRYERPGRAAAAAIPEADIDRAVILLPALTLTKARTRIAFRGRAYQEGAL